jgi:sugar lactone lactonase YvrE
MTHLSILSRLARTTLLLAASILTGCTPAGVIFPPVSPPLVFPPPPEPPRVSYVGQIATDSDLKPEHNALQGMGEVLFGKHETRSMLTPMSVCIDTLGRVCVADSNAQLIHVFDLEKRSYTQWLLPGKDGGTKLAQPVSITAAPDGRVLVVDSVAKCIYVFDSRGNLTDTWTSEHFQRPCGICIDLPGHRFFVIDSAAHQLFALAWDGHLIARVGQRGGALGQFNYPTAVAVDHQGRVYVSDTLNFRVQQFSPSLVPLRQIGQKGDLPGYFSQPKGLAIDSEDHLYVVDSQFEAVQIFNSNGQLLLDFGEEGRDPGDFWLPSGIFVSPDDRIWVADSYNRRVQVFQYHPLPGSRSPATSASDSPTSEPGSASRPAEDKP